MHRVLILADINSPHTRRWVDALLQNGFVICVFSLSEPANYENAFGEQLSIVSPKRRFASKAGYLSVLPQLKKCILNFAPDVLHAHYATSYGLLGALSGFSPFFISVWGSDILSFPHKSFIHRNILKYSLGRADRVFATGKLLSDEVSRLFNISSEIIPFGIDVDKFYPNRTSTYYPAENLVIGTVKSMEEIYRIDWIIKAFAEVQRLRPAGNLRLLIVGGGSMLETYIGLAEKLCTPGTYTFTGKVPYSRIPELTSQLDIFVHAALGESFGVSTLEAAACGKPAVVCNSGGACEVILENQTALTYGEFDYNALVSQLLILIDDKDLRISMGDNARSFVVTNFDWNVNVKRMIESYKEVLR